MNIVIGIVIFIVGAIIGFFAHKVLSTSSQKQRLLSEKASKSEADLAQYKLDVADHLENSAKLLDQMNSTCQIAMKQMEESTELLQKVTTSEQVAMPFFSKETQEQLAETASLRHEKREDKSAEIISEPPLDYSGNPSGLFADKKQSVTNTE